MTLRRRIDLPRVMRVGEGCLEEVVPLLVDHGFDVDRVYVGCGGPESTRFAEVVVSRLREAGAEVTCAAGLEGQLVQADALAAEAADGRTPTLIAVGGGRVIDTVKLAATRTGAELVSVPTAISHDGISSPVASLFGEDGRRHSHAATMPASIVVDVAVIGSAPVRTLRAGLGDLLSNLTAILDWRLAHRAGHERYDEYSAMIAESAARSVLELEDLESVESHERLAKGLVLSGLAMEAAGTSRPCSGAEHLISHALDQLLGDRAAMHGEQVALGALVSATAHESPMLVTLQDLYARLALPMEPGDISISHQDMVRAIQAAPATRPDRYTVLSEMHLSEETADALLGRAFAPVS